MYDAFISFISVFLLGVVIYASLWWQGSTMSFRVTKWYFGIFFIISIVASVYFYFKN